MSQIAYKEADAALGKRIDQAAQAEDISIEGEDGRRFKLIEHTEDKPRPTFGSAKGDVCILDGCDAPLEDFEDYL